MLKIKLALDWIVGLAVTEITGVKVWSGVAVIVGSVLIGASL